ncbi:MAG: type IV pilus assembly protein PilM, partial [Deltaproteobacteria bacterium]
GVWGIDIGLAGLKAVRLVYAEAAKQVLATAFDYVPHPKILSQPDANPEELIGLALDTFLSRNSLQGDGVAIGVPGQTALARFIQLPPVEASKVGEIVKYEARQQIPFALEEVIWDYQPLGGGVEESGFMLDAEVGLFAMKRDQVQQHLAPFLERKVEVDLIQIAPLALYNYLCHDQFGYVPGPGAPPEQEDYTLLLDMGADNTTLLVSNGRKIWNRNVPLGGNHFTRALTKEMKLTFAKAEHLKCNATKAPDPKAVFQALRPVFNDYVAEIQRSIGFFSSVNRDAKIGRIVGVGNGFKLAGLQKFLQQNLQMDVERVDSFLALAGDSVLNAPLFQENLLSFAVPYGLALQGLKITRVHTSLLPPEITTARLIRRKKPWAVATAAILLIGLTLSTIGYAHVLSTVSTERFGAAESKANDVVNKKTAMKTAYDAAKKKNEDYRKDLQSLMVAGSERTAWLEVYKAINECLPRPQDPIEADEDDPTLQNRIRIMSITSKKYDNLDEWYKSLTDFAKGYLSEDDRKEPPKGAGYVFTLRGRHFHDEPNDVSRQSITYVKNTFLHQLQQWAVPQFDPSKFAYTGVMVPVRQMGIRYATIAERLGDTKVLYSKGGPGAGEEDAAPAAAKAPIRRYPGMRARTKPKPAKADDAAVDAPRKIPMTEFIIQFAWQEVPPEKREADDPLLKKQAAAAPQAGQAATPAKTPAAASSSPATPASPAPKSPAPSAATPAPATPPGGTPAGAPATPAAPAKSN